jgi:hypothetical protein
VKEQQMAHVTLTGDMTGDYIVSDRRDDGTLVLVPESEVDASLRQHGLRRATPPEFDAFVAQHGPLLPADDEG